MLAHRVGCLPPCTPLQLGQKACHTAEESNKAAVRRRASRALLRDGGSTCSFATCNPSLRPFPPPSRLQFVAGESLEACCAALRALRQHGIGGVTYCAESEWGGPLLPPLLTAAVCPVCPPLCRPACGTAGEDAVRIQPTLMKMKASGVRAILDYAAGLCSRWHACSGHLAGTPAVQRSALDSAPPLLRSSAPAGPARCWASARMLAGQVACCACAPTCCVCCACCAEDDVEQEEGPQSRQGPQASGGCSCASSSYSAVQSSQHAQGRRTPSLLPSVRAQKLFPTSLLFCSDCEDIRVRERARVRLPHVHLPQVH